MFKDIFKTIKSYDDIVIARHVGVDPDAMASAVALKESIKLTFPEKNVYAVGNGGGKFSYLGKLDHYEGDGSNTLLIVLDTPDKRRVDCSDVDSFEYKIKIDHHPFVEEFCDIEYVNDKSSSTCELVMEMIYKTRLKTNKEIMEKLQFKGYTIHSLRHTFATRGQELGITPKQMQQWLGHSTVEITLNIYTHINKDFEQKQIALINRENERSVDTTFDTTSDTTSDAIFQIKKQTNSLFLKVYTIYCTTY